MLEISLKAEKRVASNRGAVKKLRREGMIPGVFYSKGLDPVSFTVPEITLKPLVFTGETHIINLVVGDEEPLKSIIKDVQFDPVTDRVIHVDFQGITVGQEMELQVPVMLKGNAPGIKSGGVLQHYLHKLDIVCLPKHIPEHLEINISGLNLGDTIHIRDLQFENLRILNSEDIAVVSVLAPRGTSEDATASEASEIKEPEVIGKGKSVATED